jgi:hypothetical protein
VIGERIEKAGFLLSPITYHPALITHRPSLADHFFRLFKANQRQICWCSICSVWRAALLEKARPTPNNQKERMMRTDIARRLSITLAIVCAVLTLSAPAEAQRRRGTPRQRGYTKAQVNQIIKRVEERSDRFVRLFDRSLDRSRLDGSNREDRLNEQARNLETALDELRREFDRKENYVETRPEVRRCLDIATNINVAMRNRRLGGETEKQWALLRAELNTLADVYSLPFIGSAQY